MGAAWTETGSSETSFCLALFKTHLFACSKSSERDRQRLLGYQSQTSVAFTDFCHDLRPVIWDWIHKSFQSGWNLESYPKSSCFSNHAFKKKIHIQRTRYPKLPCARDFVALPSGRVEHLRQLATWSSVKPVPRNLNHLLLQEFVSRVPFSDLGLLYRKGLYVNTPRKSFSATV